MANRFDFIIVGGGTAGSLLAYRLSNAPSNPSVLLVEAGGDGLPTERRQPYQRYANAFVLPDLEYGYKTVPQLGLVGANYHISVEKDLVALVCSTSWFIREAQLQIGTDGHILVTRNGTGNIPRSAFVNHGYSGDLHISVPEKELESKVRIIMDAGEELGWPINPDVNSGDIMGISIVPLTSGGGQRFSSEKAFLQCRPNNLTTWTFSQVAKILFEGKTAVGIKTVEGKKAYASKEVIVTAGSIDSPKLLLLSGLGPASELEAHGIKAIHDLPAVDKNAEDHVLVFLNELMDRSFSAKWEFALDHDQQAAAFEEWTANHSGPLSFHGSSNTILFQKDETVYDTDAFKSLNEDTQKFLRKPEIPTFEIMTSGPLIPPDYPMTPDLSFASQVLVVMNPQSRGSLTLQSKDALDMPLIDPGFLAHPYDIHCLMAAVRAERNLMKTNIMKKHHKGPISAPKSESDKDALAFIKDTASPVWHFSSTAKMGKSGDMTAVVDSNMKVFGVQNLRVADISVCPFNPNAHTQAAAYLIGQTAADKIICEYGL